MPPRGPEATEACQERLSACGRLLLSRCAHLLLLPRECRERLARCIVPPGWRDTPAHPRAGRGPFGWATQEQMSVASQLGAAHASANLCNHEIDEVGTARVIRTRIVSNGTPTPE